MLFRFQVCTFVNLFVLLLENNDFRLLNYIPFLPFLLLSKRK